jgi:hypothetical protein
MKTKYLKQFEKYYNGEMEPDEKASFEEALSDDQELNASYKEYLSIYEALSDHEILDLRMKLKEIREENARDKNYPDFFRHGYNWLWMAALITIIISFTLIVSLMINRAKLKDQLASGINTAEIHKYSALDGELMKFKQRNVELILESPKDSLFFHREDPLRFQWTVNLSDPLILDLIDWEGKIVFSSVKPVTSPYVVKKKLPGGMLVYRLRTDTESYYIGFLFLK